MIVGTQLFGIKEIVTSCVYSFIFICDELMAGALWFVPTFILSSTIFGMIIYFSNKIFDYLKYNKKIKNYFILISTVFCGSIGIYLVTRQVSLLYHFQIYQMLHLYYYDYLLLLSLLSFLLKLSKIAAASS